jgi:hypothetical protein
MIFSHKYQLIKPKINMKKKILSAAIVLLVVIGSVSAQDYKTALGVKFYPGAITLKHFISDKAALEGIGYFYNHGTRITGLYEFHFDIPNADNLRWYVGPGAHVGFYNTKYGGGSQIGIDGVLGLDYKIKSAPINLSLDWQPSFEFGNAIGNGFGGSWGGFAIRYVLQ